MSYLKKYPSIIFSIASLSVTIGSMIYIVGAKGEQLADHEKRLNELENQERRSHELLFEMRQDIKWIKMEIGK